MESAWYDQFRADVRSSLIVRAVEGSISRVAAATAATATGTWAVTSWTTAHLASASRSLRWARLEGGEGGRAHPRLDASFSPSPISVLFARGHECIFLSLPDYSFLSHYGAAANGLKAEVLAVRRWCSSRRPASAKKRRNSSEGNLVDLEEWATREQVRRLGYVGLTS